MTSETVSSPPKRFGKWLYPLMLVAAMWVIWAVDAILPVQVARSLGVRARDTNYLAGILTYPLAHIDFAHLLANTVPLLILSYLVVLGEPRRFVPLSLAVWVGSGALLWVAGSSLSVTIGASGLVFGYFGYLVVRPFRQRSLGQALLYGLVGLAVTATYGLGMFFGMIPGLAGANISWQAHLFGFICGAGFALYSRVPGDVGGNGEANGELGLNARTPR